MTERQYNCFLTADTALLVNDEVLLAQRKNDPFKGKWCIPGGFVDEDEKILDGALRELREETGVSGVEIEEFGTYGDPGRDPRGRTVTVVYLCRLASKPEVQAADDAADCKWFPIDRLPDMAFDHAKILSDVRKYLDARKGG